MFPETRACRPIASNCPKVVDPGLFRSRVGEGFAVVVVQSLVFGVWTVERKQSTKNILFKVSTRHLAPALLNSGPPSQD